MSEGLGLFIENWRLLIAGALVLVAISLITDLIAGPGVVLIPQSGMPVEVDWGRLFIALLINILVFPLVATGYEYMVLRTAREENASLEDILAPFSRFLSVLGAIFLWLLVVTVGFFLLIVPGIVWALKYMYAPLLVVDRGLTAVEAMGESGRLTYGYKWKLFLLGLVFGLVIELSVGLILMGIASASWGLGLLLGVVAHLFLYPWYTAAFVVAYRGMWEELEPATASGS